MDGHGDRRVGAFVVLLIMSIALPTVLVLGWGKEGHYAICKITQVM